MNPCVCIHLPTFSVCSLALYAVCMSTCVCASTPVCIHVCMYSPTRSLGLLADILHSAHASLSGNEHCLSVSHEWETKWF